MLSSYQTTPLLYMILTICALINLIFAIPLYLKSGVCLRIETLGLLLPTFQERRTIMEMQNHAENKLNWNGCLTKKNFTKIISEFQFQPEVYLFASRLNAQLQVLVSYHPDPETMHINAFSISWQGRPFCAFPLFTVIEKVLNKIVLDVATEIHVVSNWLTLLWIAS